MKTHQIVIISLLAITFLIQGCTSTKTNLVKEGYLSTERLQTKRFRIWTIHAYRENDHMKVSGYVRRDYFYRGYAPGHVDITIVSPDDTVLKKVATVYTPRNIRSKGARTAHFTARISEIPPKGSVVQAVHHQGGIKPECTDS